MQSAGSNKEDLIQKGCEFLDAGKKREDLRAYLLQFYRNDYQNSSSTQSQQPSNASSNDTNRNQQRDTQGSGNTNPSTPMFIASYYTCHQHKSGFDFWDIIFFSWLFNRGGNTTIINTSSTPSTGSRDNKSDNSVLGPCIAAFCLIFIAVASYALLAYAAYKIKNSKLENNETSVPSAVCLGILSFSVSATLTLLLLGVIVPDLESAMELSQGAFTGFQAIIGLNALIFGLGAMVFFYLAIDKVSKKAFVDREVDRIMSQGPGSSPSHYANSNQPYSDSGRQFQHNPYQTSGYAPSAPPSYDDTPPPYSPPSYTPDSKFQQPFFFNPQSYDQPRFSKQ